MYIYKHLMTCTQHNDPLNIYPSRGDKKPGNFNGFVTDV